VQGKDDTVGGPGTPDREVTGPRVLVAVESKHGSTRGIAEALARDLADSVAGRSVGLTAVAISVEQQPDPSAFDVVVLGSAVYVGRWLEPARQFASTHITSLRSRPVWLFSSGPIGQPPFPPDEPHDAQPIGAMLAARGHRVFPGRLEKDLLSVGERAMVTAMRAPLGDFRDWGLVRSWAEEIASAIAEDAAVAPARDPR
jgi:menaquinone-dependent protoporphyrinogen oxidase